MDVAMKRLSDHLSRKSVGAIASLEHGFGRVLLFWSIIAAFIGALRISLILTITPCLDSLPKERCK